MTCPLSSFTSLQTRQLKAPQVSHHHTVPISQFFRRSELRILVLQAHYQITQSTEHHPSNTLRAERLLDVFSRIVGLSKVHVRSRKVQSSKSLSGWAALG